MKRKDHNSPLNDLRCVPNAASNRTASDAVDGSLPKSDLDVIIQHSRSFHSSAQAIQSASVITTRVATSSRVANEQRHPQTEATIHDKVIAISNKNENDPEVSETGAADIIETTSVLQSDRRIWLSQTLKRAGRLLSYVKRSRKNAAF